MAKKQSGNNSLVNTGFQNPLVGYEDIIPNQRYEQAQATADAYARAYADSAGFGVKHPFLSGGLGLLLGGPVGAIALPMAGKKNQQARQQETLEAYNAYAQNQIENIDRLKALDRTKTDRNIYANMGIDPSFLQGATSDEASKAYLEGIAAGPGLQQGRDALFGAYQDAMNMSQGQVQNPPRGPQLPQQLPPLSAGPMLDPGPQAQTLTPSSARGFQIMAQEQGEPPLRPYTYQSPDLAKQTLSSIGTLIGNVNENTPEYAQLPAQIQKLVAEGKSAEALALLRSAQTKTEGFRPALVQSQIGANQALTGLRNRTPGGGAGRAPSVIDLMTPEQKAQYAGRIASGPAGNGVNTGIKTLGALQKVIFSDTASADQKTSAVQLYNQLAPTLGQPGLEATQESPSLMNWFPQQSYRPASQPSGGGSSRSIAPGKKIGGGRQVTLPSGRKVAL